LSKAHYEHTLEIDEEVFKELKQIQRSLVEYNRNILGPSTLTIFIEQNEENEHLIIDSVAIPHSEEVEFDIEVTLSKSLLESESEWERTNSKSLIDTKSYKGDLSRYLPNKGKFNFVHVDVDGKGGFAKMIENKKSFPACFIIKVIAEGPLQLDMYNLR